MADQAEQVGDWRNPAVHFVYRTYQLDLDYLTIFIMLYAFNAWTNPALFHSGWFVEGSAVQAYKKRGLLMAPGIEWGMW